MFNDKERKEIFDIAKKYKSAHMRAMNNCRSRSASRDCETLSKQGFYYLDKLYDSVDDLTDEDIKCFVLLVDAFEPMRRDRMLKDLQKRAGFDINLFLETQNNTGLHRVFSKKDKKLKEMSADELKKCRIKYKSICDDINNGKRVSYNSKVAETYRTQAYAYARAIVNGDIVVSPENIESAYMYLRTICFPYIDGDVADRAEILLKDKMEQVQSGAVQQKAESLKQRIEQEKIAREKAKREEAARLKQEREQKKKIKQEQAEQRKQQIKDERLKRKEELAERIKELKANIAEKRQKCEKQKQQERAQRAHELEVMAEQERLAHEKAKQERAERRKVRREKIAGIVGGIKSGIDEKKTRLSEKYNAFKQARESKKQEKQQDKQNVDKSVFVSVLPYLAAWVMLSAGIGVVIKTMPNETNNNNDQKKAKTVLVQDVKTDVAVDNTKTVALDTAYAAALKNYYNSALDIIAGANKKVDVLSKVENQVANGNFALTDSVTVERVAYAYFIYREYGFKKDVLELAVNGNQKLTDDQQAELIQVIMDAGERGTGVQKMAKKVVEARGGQMSKHSNFEHATKKQQREHIKSLLNLKKAHVK